jgi:transposase
MAGKPKSMSQIKQLLILHRQGHSIKAIARSLSMSRNTVKAYLYKLEKLVGDPAGDLCAERILAMEEPEVYHLFHAGNPSYKDDRYGHFKGQLDYFLKELRRTGVTRALLWEEYRQGRPDGYGYSQFCHHLDQHGSARNRPSARLEHAPAEKLYIDFAGKTIPYIDRETGELVQCQLFVACLPFSDYSFAMAVRSQTQGDFLHALASCLEFLEGVPQILVPDNFKAAVAKADRYEPDINRALEDFASHYGMAVVPARAARPKDKARVENQVKILYSRIHAKLRNRQFFDLYSLNEAIRIQLKAHNQTRMKQKGHCREEQFLASEKPLLNPLPAERFELRHHAELTLSKNNHVYLARDKHYYSAPHTLIGKKLKVIYTRSMVQLYYQGKKVAVHVRSFKAGGYSTLKDHLCSHHQHYGDRSPDYYRDLAAKRSPVLGRYVSKLFEQDRFPEQLYKTCDGLLSLFRKADLDTFEKACQLGMDNGEYSYRFIKNVLENHTAHQDQHEPEKPLPQHRNVRGKDYYRQEKLQF